MRVIRSYRDYYDGALSAFSMEQVPLYIRKREEVPLSNVPLYNKIKEADHLPSIYATLRDKESPFYLLHRNVTLTTGVLGFCGKLYPIYHTGLLLPSLGFSDGIPCVGAKSLLSLFEVCNTTFFFRRGSPLRNLLEMEKEILSWGCWQEVFLHYSVPSFVCIMTKRGEWRLILNPCLKEFGMQSVLHSYTAAQELEMFLTGPLCDKSSPPVPVGGDKVIARSKGFDDKSFRKGSTKRK